MKPIRVLHTGMSFNKGGKETLIMNLYRNIDRTKIQFDFITTHEKLAFEEEICQLGGKIIRLKKSRKYSLQWFRTYYDFFKNQNEYKIIHCNHVSLYSINELFFSRMFKIPIIILHSHSSALTNNKVKTLVLHKLNHPIAMKCANRFLACSKNSAQFMFGDKFIKEKEYYLLNNGINVEKFSFNESKRLEVRKKLGIENEFVVGNVAAFLPVKNHSFVIEIFFEILKLRSNSTLLLVGSGKLEDIIKKQVYKLGIGKKVKFIGMIDNVDEIIQSFDCFLLPSLSEGFPLSLVEAQAAGLKCFTSLGAVPCEVNITGLVKHLELSKEAKYWAEIVLSSSANYNRISRVEELTHAGFNIKKLSSELCDFYLDNVKRQVDYSEK